jgi:hypothetical protein
MGDATAPACFWTVRTYPSSWMGGDLVGPPLAPVPRSEVLDKLLAALPSVQARAIGEPVKGADFIPGKIATGTW